MRLPRGRDAEPDRPCLPLRRPLPNSGRSVLFCSGAEDLRGSRLRLSLDQTRAGSFASPEGHAMADPGEDCEPPGDTLGLLRLRGTPQPLNCGGKCHSRRLTRRQHERRTHAMQPNDARNSDTRYATHKTSPVQQWTTATRTADRPIPAQRNTICRTSQPTLRVRNTDCAEEEGTYVRHWNGPLATLPAGQNVPNVFQPGDQYTPRFTSQIWHIGGTK